MVNRSKWMFAGVLALSMPIVALSASARPMQADLAFALPAVTAALSRDAAAPLVNPVVSAWDVAATAKVAEPQAPPKPKPTPTPTAAPKPAPQAAARPIDDDFAKGAYPGDAPGVVAPVAIYQQKPRYTPDAMRAKLQGAVSVEIIIMPDGTVGKARIKDSLDRLTGLDEQALIAARTWTFVPGTFEGNAVPIYAVVILEFRLH